MFKRRTRFAVLAAVLALSFLSAASAETWYLEHGSDWQSLSDETKKALVKADRHDAKGKSTRAVRSYNKFLDACSPESELYAAALNRQFSIAEEYLAGRRIRVLGIFRMKGYATGVKVMERISNRADKAIITLDTAVQAAQSTQEKQKLENARDRLKTIGRDAAVQVAQNYEQRKKLDLAYLKWFEIFETYDTMRKQALLAMARCKYLAYEGPGYDASDLTGRTISERAPYDGAKGCYQEFQSQYPQDAGNLQVDKTIEKINEQLAYKDFTTGRYYQKTGNQQAANLYYQMVIRDWPATKAAQMASEMLIQNSGGRVLR